MYPYPRQFPVEAFQVMSDYYLDSVALERKTIIHAGWVLAGYSLGRILGGGPLVIGKKSNTRSKKVESDQIKPLIQSVKLAIRYGTFDKLEKENPDLWKQLKSMADDLLSQ